MKTAGVIAEYNPLHNGHKYQLHEIRRRTGADYIVVIMSGDFVQRGEPAILDKYTRASMALSAGADLVLELPALYATASAELFARGGVLSLMATGCLDHLCFGAETDLPDLLCSAARILADEPEDYRNKLRENQKKGLSFPAAREDALMQAMSTVLSSDITIEELRSALNQPNNILAIEYLKQLLLASGKSTGDLAGISEAPSPILIPRKGSAYHDMELTDGFASASAIRAMLMQEKALPVRTSMTVLTDWTDLTDRADRADQAEKANTADQYNKKLQKYVPEMVLRELQSAALECRLIFPEALSPALSYKLEMLSSFERFDGVAEQLSSTPNISAQMFSAHINSSTQPLSAYADCSAQLLNRILHNRYDYESFNQYNDLIKNKSVTHSHVRRALLHILMDYKEDLRTYYIEETVPYLRVLGFRKASADLLSAIRKNASVPVITRPVEEFKALQGYAAEAARLDLFASDFYNSLVRMQSGARIKNDFSHPMIII